MDRQFIERISEMPLPEISEPDLTECPYCGGSSFRRSWTATLYGTDWLNSDNGRAGRDEDELDEYDHENWICETCERMPAYPVQRELNRIFNENY